MQNHLSKIKEFLDSGTTKAKATKIALCIVALAALPGLILLAASIGNAVQVFGGFRTSKYLKKNQIRDALGNLRRQRLIEYVANKDGQTIVRITKKGESKLRAFSIELIEIKKPNRWDGKWRLVMYDIPVRFSKARESLRWQLKEFGFVQLQKSAWILPYPCEDEIIFVADFYGVGKYVEILTIESFLHEDRLRKHFGLK